MIKSLTKLGDIRTNYTDNLLNSEMIFTEMTLRQSSFKSTLVNLCQLVYVKAPRSSTNQVSIELIPHCNNGYFSYIQDNICQSSIE